MSQKKESSSLFSPLTNSVKEFEHVAWPSRPDAIKYLLITLGVIISMTILLSIIGIAFRESLFGARDIIREKLHIQDSTTQSNLPEDFDINKLLSASGVTLSTGAITATGSMTGANLVSPSSSTGTRSNSGAQ
ncbi:MAG: preprotein translocase subunit SecE [Candidatus Gracilibacteria bacterium]